MNSAIGNTSGAPSNGGPNQNMNNVGRPGICKTWVSLIQHLLVTSIQGDFDLHADNIFTFGANLTEFILNRCAPIQCTPARSMIYESFVHVDNDVLPLRSRMGARPEYFVRSINDNGAINNGCSTELPAVIGAHPLEDIMHMGSWLQLATILNQGNRVRDFRTFPTYNGRPPELVRGRTYPVLGMPGSGIRGTVCLHPQNRLCALIVLTMPDEVAAAPRPPLLLRPGLEFALQDFAETIWSYAVVPVDKWWNVLQHYNAMVAPLVARRYAVYATGDKLFVSAAHVQNAFPDIDYSEQLFPVSDDVSDDERDEAIMGEDAAPDENVQYLDFLGQYRMINKKNEFTLMDFEDAHEALVLIGGFLLVKTSALQAFGLGCNRDWVRVSLRYPDEGEISNTTTSTEDESIHIYFAIKTRDRNNAGPMKIRVLHAKAEEFLHPDSITGQQNMPRAATEVFAMPMAGVMQQPPPPPGEEGVEMEE